MSILAACALWAAPVAAQLGGLPQVGIPPVDRTVGDVLDPLTDRIERLDERATRTVERLARDRLRMIDRLVRRHDERIERDRNGDPARRGELLATGLDAAQRAALEKAGYRLLGEEAIEGLDMTVARIAVPAGISLAEAEAVVAALAPLAVVTPDHLYFQAGSGGSTVAISAQSGSRAIATPVGMIDGGAGSATPVTERKGFAEGAPRASHHGSAVADLLRQAGVQRIYAADVYGSDPAGGNALAIARALGWTIGRGSKVVTISLVGPRNPVLEGAIREARRRGAVIVAAVGNDGPAAPPAFPASYDGVVAVTGVDRRNRALIEAGRALHLDYAAPGADFRARDARGRRVSLRGTSYAAPLVAARIAAYGTIGWRAGLDREARDLGPKGPDTTYGRGLICGDCVSR